MRWLLLALLVGCSGSDDDGGMVDAAPRPDAPSPPDAGRERCSHRNTTMMGSPYACTGWHCCLTATNAGIFMESCSLGSKFPDCGACQTPSFYEPPCRH